MPVDGMQIRPHPNLTNIQIKVTGWADSNSSNEILSRFQYLNMGCNWQIEQISVSQNGMQLTDWADSNISTWDAIDRLSRSQYLNMGCNWQIEQISVSQHGMQNMRMEWIEQISISQHGMQLTNWADLRSQYLSRGCNLP